jgi:hypothetical protein
MLIQDTPFYGDWITLCMDRPSTAGERFAQAFADKRKTRPTRPGFTIS